MSTAVSLKQLAEAKTDGVQKATYFKLHPSVPKFEEGFNLRSEGPDLDAHVKQLAEAMKAGAVMPPIDVQIVDGEVIVRDGHCRTRAALQLLDEGIEYLLEARQIRGNDADAVFHMLGSDSRKNFSPLEVGRGYSRLRAYGLDVAAIATRLGVHRSTVENGLALADAPVAVQKMVDAGKVSSHLALKTVREHGAKAAAGVLKAAVETAETKGKGKATAKHVEPAAPKVKAVRDVLSGKTPLPVGTQIHSETGEVRRGQTLPPATDRDALFALALELASLNILVTTLDRETVGNLVQKARSLVGVA